MALTSGIEQFYIKPMPGMSSKLEDLEQAEKFAELVQNGRFEEEPGTLKKRQPISYYNGTTMGSAPVMGGYRFYKSDGTYKTIAVQGSDIYVGVSGTMTALTLPQGLTLTEGKRMAFVTYKDLVIMSNGFDNIMAYDGTSDNLVWELGACKAKLASGGTNLDSGAIYYYAVVFNDAADGSGTDLSVCGAVSNPITTNAGNRKCDLSEIPIGPPGTLSRKLYRVEGGGSALKLLHVLGDNSTTTYTDDIADGSLGAAFPTITDAMPLGNILKIHRERLFVTGDPSNPNKIDFSDPYLPWFISHVTNSRYLEIDKNDGDEIMGIPLQLGVMVCIKRNTIRPIHVTSPVSGADPDTWYAEDPKVFTGSPAQWSIVQTTYGIVFLGWDHWYLYDGARLTPVMDEFDTGEILLTDYNDTVCFWDNNILYASYTDALDANEWHDKMMRYNFLRKKMAIDRFVVDDEPTGINCFFSYNGDDEYGDVYYGDSRNGFVYRAEDNPQWLRWNKKSQLETSTVRDMFIGGTEDDPWFEVGWDLTIDELTTTNVTATGTLPAWSAATTYVLGDVATSGGNTYVCKLTNINNVPPNATYWTATATAIDIDNLPGTIDRNDTKGAIIFEAVQLNAGSLTELFWNQRKYVAADTVEFYIRTGATEAACETGESCTADFANNQIDDVGHSVTLGDRVSIIAGTMPTGLEADIMYYAISINANDFQLSLTSGGSAVAFTDAGATVTYKVWEGPYDDFNGEDLSGVTANIWLQMQCNMVCNSTAGSPRVYYSDGFVIKMSYRIGGTIAEDAIEFIFETGDRNFNAPMIDKIFKKLFCVHEGSSGTFDITWTTENATGTFTIDLANFPERWDSFFPSNAMGTELSFRIYKNDLEDLKLKEIKGLYTPEPIIV